MVVFDNFALAFSILLCVITFFWLWMTADYFHEETHVTDQAALVLFVLAGGVLLTSFNNMAMLFLGIEILSLSLYVLAGSRKESLLSNESSFKYFLMGSFATGFLLMGIALVYGATGLFHLDRIGMFISSNSAHLPTFFYVGVLLIIVGMAFKISAVPFHFWAPDVYEGAPTPITALMATLVKAAAFAALYRILSISFPGVQGTYRHVLEVLTVATLVVANVTAVYQVNVKRMLAYSSVGHAGYLLLGLLGTGPFVASTLLYYLAAYSAATLTAFCILIEVERRGVPTVDAFNGLFKRNPFLAVVMTLALLSMAGIPPLSGFFAKYMVFSLAIFKGYLEVVIVAVITSLIGVFYYFKVIVAMYFKDTDLQPLAMPNSRKILLIILISIVLGLGLFPDLLIIL
jgi:NADH-quinone oxidoreductase subunit N